MPVFLFHVLIVWLSSCDFAIASWGSIPATAQPKKRVSYHKNESAILWHHRSPLFWKPIHFCTLSSDITCHTFLKTESHLPVPTSNPSSDITPHFLKNESGILWHHLPLLFTKPSHIYLCPQVPYPLTSSTPKTQKTSLKYKKKRVWNRIFSEFQKPSLEISQRIL